MFITLETPSVMPALEKAVVVITTEMPSNGVDIPANAVVFDQELFPGTPLQVEVKAGQYLTISPFSTAV